MKKIILLALLGLVHTINAQSTLVEIKLKLEKEYQFETVNDFIDLADELPIAVPVGERDSADWIAARTQCVELYLLWYEGMEDLGFRMTEKAIYLQTENAPDTIETAKQIQARITANKKVEYKKHAVSTFLDAEQRLKLFVKDAYKKKKRKMFNVELYQFGEPYAKLSSQIMRQIIDSSFGIVLYENKIKKGRKENINILAKKN